MITARALLHGDADAAAALRRRRAPRRAAARRQRARRARGRGAARRCGGLRRDQSQRRLPERPRAGRLFRRGADARARARGGVRAVRCAPPSPCPSPSRRASASIDHDSYEFVRDFIAEVAAAGCTTFIVHARKAWLSGLSPKQNREIPPLDYAPRASLEARVSGAAHRHQRRLRDARRQRRRSSRTSTAS